jgi:two-component system OmpR family sensor kinase
MKKIFAWFNSLQPHSLRYQLLTRSMLILAVLLLLIGIVQYVVLQQFLYRSQINSIENRLQAVPLRAWEMLINGNGETRGVRGAFNAFQERGTTISIIDSAGNVFPILSHLPGEEDDSRWNDMKSSREEIPQLTPSEYQEAFASSKKLKNVRIVQAENRHKHLFMLYPIGTSDQILRLVQVTYNLKMIDMTLLRALWTFLIGAFLALLAGLFTYLATIRRTLGPLSNIIYQVKQINAGNLDQRIPELREQQEVAELASSFNEMLSRIETSFIAEKEAKETMRRFIADASHELRTPLTSIHGFLEILLRGAAKNPEQLEQSLKSMYRESERINKLVLDLLSLAKFDQKPKLMKTRFSLGSILQEMEPQLRLIAEQRQVLLQITRDELLDVDTDRIKQLILNIFQNAVTHTDAVQGRIEVTIDADTHYAILQISDNGQGIDPQHLPHIFERFYREESSRSRQTGGAGLGLSIVMSIVELHQGDIEVTSQLNMGTTFIVKLPLF